MDVAAVLLPLVGVALGTAGTLTGQYVATRHEARRHASERAAAARAELRQAIIDYLDAVQPVEKYVDDESHARPTTAALDGLLHTMWLRKKILELVCEAPLARAAHRYASVLAGLPGQRPPGGQSAEQKQARAVFMEAARRALDIDGPPLYPV